MCCEDTDQEMYPWRQDLCCSGSKSDLIIHTFTNLLYKLAFSRLEYYFKIALREKDVLIAYKVDYNILMNLNVIAHEQIRTVHLNDCDISSAEYETLCLQATKIYIYNGHVEKSYFEALSAKSSIKEIFIHNLQDIDAQILMPSILNSSILVVTKNMLFGYKPTTEHVMLALQLEPWIDTLMLYNCQGNIDIFNRVMTLLSTNPND